MEKKTTYRIIVKGILPGDWSDRLQGMRISVARSDEQKPLTILEGALRDQAALAGVLDTLYQLRLKVLSVECLDKSES